MVQNKGYVILLKCYVLEFGDFCYSLELSTICVTNYKYKTDGEKISIKRLHKRNFYLGLFFISELLWFLISITVPSMSQIICIQTNN